MDRATLNYLLSSGPSRMFNLCDRLRARVPEGEPPLQPPFATEWLNHSIIFKYFDESDRTLNELREDQFPTLIFLPYDPLRPAEGGESFFFTHRNLDEFFASRTEADPKLRPKLLQDRPLLDIFNSLPTLSPFLIGEQLDRHQLGTDRRLLALPLAFKSRIRDRLAARLRPLVVAAFGENNKRLGAAIEGFVDKLVDGCDRDGLDPLITALRLDPETASQTFQAWVGITYFEEEFHDLQISLKSFVTWLGQYGLPRENMPRDLRLHFDSMKNNLRGRIREDWQMSKDILIEYRESYSELLKMQKPKRFVLFLGKAGRNYGLLGDVLGRLEQIISYWRDKTKPYGGQALPYEACEEFYDVMKQSYIAVSRKAQKQKMQTQHEFV